ncbi:MAG: hypothetical protein LBL90_02320 [Prevotellaceae bacterium]|jgi:hypothetical protein|nr:hypothetical protein [Prevotellaceae bacterium]
MIKFKETVISGPCVEARLALKKIDDNTVEYICYETYGDGIEAHGKLVKDS